MATLADYVRASPKDAAYVADCAATAEILVARLVGTAKVPTEVREHAVLATGANLFSRRLTTTELNNYSNGLVQSIPQRPALDPLTPARGILAGHLGPGIA